MPVCPLCNKPVSHFKTNSHVIPEWMYKGSDIYDAKGRIVEFDFPNHKKILHQKGYRGNFICSNCEEETAKLDHYASLIFRSNNYSPPGFQKTEKYPDEYVKQTPASPLLEKIQFLDGFDFKKIQNFVYSICLRQHFYDLSKNKKSLIISKHLSPILNLYHSNCIDDESYPIFILCFSRDTELYKPIVSPYVDKMNGHYIIQFGACGFQFIVQTSSHKGLFSNSSIKLKSDGSIYIGQIKPENSGMLKKVIFQLRKKFPVK